MTRAKAWFDKLTTLSKVEGQRPPRNENNKFEARNPKFEINSNERNKTTECSKQPFFIDLRGGLFPDFAPSFYHLEHVLLALLQRMPLL